MEQSRQKIKRTQPSPNSIFNYHYPKEVKLLTRLRLGLSHLCDHKFKHSFQNLLNSICNCGTDVETTTHYHLYCPLFSDERLILINNIWKINSNILSLTDSRFLELLLFQGFPNSIKRWREGGTRNFVGGGGGRGEGDAHEYF